VPRSRAGYRSSPAPTQPQVRTPRSRREQTKSCSALCRRARCSPTSWIVATRRIVEDVHACLARLLRIAGSPVKPSSRAGRDRCRSTTSGPSRSYRSHRGAVCRGYPGLALAGQRVPRNRDSRHVRVAIRRRGDCSKRCFGLIQVSKPTHRKGWVVLLRAFFGEFVRTRPRSSPHRRPTPRTGNREEPALLAARYLVETPVQRSYE